MLGEYARAGNLTLGGGPAVVAELQRRLFRERRWLAEEEFGLFYAISRLTPGTNVLAFIAATGARLGGTALGVLAVVAASLPAAFVVWAMSLGYERWQGLPWVAAAMRGAMAAVVAVILGSAWEILRPAMRGGGASVAIFGLALGVGLAGWAGPVTILAGAAVAGAVLLAE